MATPLILQSCDKFLDHIVPLNPTLRDNREADTELDDGRQMSL
jgi:hypothetical protein